MSNDPHPELDFPTCAEAAGIGFVAIPDLLWDMEDDCGAGVMKAMVLAYGGLELTVSKVHHFPWERDPLIQGRAWLAAEQGAVEGMEDEQDGMDEGYQQDALAELIRKLSDAMGLPPDTDAEGLIRAARDLKNPAKMVPAEAVRDMLAERRTGLALLAEDAAQRKVADALQSAFITPGMKDWALDLCRKDPASFDTFCGAAPPAFGHVAGSQFDRAILREALTPAGSPVLSGQEAEIAAVLGLAPEKLR